MNNYVTGSTIRLLREKKGYTQKQLAEKLSVSDKAVSKWESGRGLPDISLIEPLALTLGVSLTELLSGACVQNSNRHGNMLKSLYYVCPVCGNVIVAAGAGVFSCCGVLLPPLEPEEGDADHEIMMERIEGDAYLTMRHPMDKAHYISFFALVSSDKVQIVKLYPEQNAEARIPVFGRGKAYAYCNRHGLIKKQYKRQKRTVPGIFATNLSRIVIQWIKVNHIDTPNFKGAEIMSAAVVYYTFGGSTKKEAERIGKEQDAPVFRVREAKNRSLIGSFIPGGFQAMKRKKPKIQPVDFDLNQYDRIYIGCPVWAANPAPAFNAILDLLPAGKEVELFFCSGGNDPRGSDAETKRLVEARGCTVTRILTIPTGVAPAKMKE